MTPDHVKAQLRSAIHKAVEMGWKEHGKRTIAGVQVTAASYAEMLVMPAVDLLADEAVQTAVRDACEPWKPVWDLATCHVEAPIPDGQSPLFSLWLSGVLTVCDTIAKRLGVPVDIDGDGLDIQDSDALIQALVSNLMRQVARQTVRS
jgi:hypothetical protein